MDRIEASPTSELEKSILFKGNTYTLYSLDDIKEIFFL